VKRVFDAVADEAGLDEATVRTIFREISPSLAL
jgi:hypothetical protein